MKSIKRCPECNQMLSSSSCLCGWQGLSNTENCRNDLCAYRSQGRQCRYTGTSSSFPYGKGSYYCSGHRENIGNIEVCEMILSESEFNSEKKNEERIDWRRRLFIDEFAASKKIK